MAIRTALTVLGFALIALANPATTHARDGAAECSCCTDDWAGPTVGDFEHFFPEGRDYCENCSSGGNNIAGAANGTHCVLCGGSSSCHTDPQPNVCHVSCGNWNCNPHMDPKDPNCDTETIASVEIDQGYYISELVRQLERVDTPGEEAAAWVLAGLIAAHPGLELVSKGTRLQMVNCSGLLVSYWTLTENLTAYISSETDTSAGIGT